MPRNVNVFGVILVAASPLTTCRSSQPAPSPIQYVKGRFNSLASFGIFRNHSAPRNGFTRSAGTVRVPYGVLGDRVRDTRRTVAEIPRRPAPARANAARAGASVVAQTPDSLAAEKALRESGSSSPG